MRVNTRIHHIAHGFASQKEMRGRGREDKLRLARLLEKKRENDGEPILADIIVECFPQVKIDYRSSS